MLWLLIDLEFFISNHLSYTFKIFFVNILLLLLALAST